MKHTTKPVPRASKTAKNRMIGLRLDDALMAEIEKLAEVEMRTLADMARICVRRGLADLKNRVERNAG
ncbi:hypothetical protein [Pusillimonas sp. NJUB218]|uniref:hypothetical protein n=1 Tax=Pusillimonas sp. NJUB218 TaxID=2023230 RepID=UPI000F4B917D|nr:hypothetical protein [Pusillimonas sp. NJUB218]ROT46094.1 hypothetical protein CHR62_03710 [Pusillimonas sp. NJUB218]